MFPTSCSKLAQEDVERGLAMMHSFLFDDAESQFNAAAEADPACAMAHWAVAIGMYRPLVYLPSAEDMKHGWQAAQKAHELEPKTQRERDYVDAAATLYRPDDRNYTERNHEYSQQLEKIYKTYPDDIEAAVLYALSLLTWADSNDFVGDTEKAIAILTPVFAQHPDHPGVAHYIIHAADTPELAQEGLAAARHYAQIAPDAPHALHMPSHIFARLGLWQEDIQSNLASLHAAQNSSRVHGGGEHQLHAMEFLEYAYLQIGQDDRAKEMVEAQARVAFDQVDSNLHNYVNRTRANSPALYYLESRDWKAAEALRPDPSAEEYNRSIIYWAQAVAAGHLRDLSAAQHAVHQYDAMLEATKNGPRPGIAKQMTTRHDEAHAWLLFLQGKSEEATELLGKLANKQDVDGKGEIETPAREMLADMLLEMNRFSEALAEYERSMNIDPNRFNGLYGAGRAAEFLGVADKARDYYGHLLRNCSTVRSQRLELIHARGILLATRERD